MPNTSFLRGTFALAAGLILVAGPDALAAQERERGPATQMTRSSQSSTPSTASATRGSARVDRNGPRSSASRNNPRTNARRPEGSPGRSGRHSASATSSRGGRGDRHYDGHRRYGHRRYSRGRTYYSHYSYYYPRSPFYWYGFYYPFYYGHHAYRYPYGHYDRYGHSSGKALGALDLDVRPEKAEIYIDGRFVGIADNFDGFPSYLWLEPGTYEVSFYKEGFETITREVKLPPGTVLDFNDRMVSGNAVKPEPLPEPVAAASTEDRDFERKAEEWREKARKYKDRKQADDAEGTLDARGEPGRIFLIVRPGDASVYLDGRFLGTGDELSRLHSGLIVDPGEHEIEVVRPGFASEAKAFSVESGEELDLMLRLQGPANDA